MTKHFETLPPTLAARVREIRSNWRAPEASVPATVAATSINGGTFQITFDIAN